MKNFALIGAGGYVAPKHMNAIQNTGNKLIAAIDPKDSVGILDKYSHDTQFFTEFERFDRYCEKRRKHWTTESPIDYVSICSPNYLHDAHCRFALRIKADAICEKPLVLRPWNIDALKLIEDETHHQIHPILQLRLHPAITKLKKKVENSPDMYKVKITYITPRGRWYDVSWKGDSEKSGGITTNIGIHFFDMLLWIFGPLDRLIKYKQNRHTSSGIMFLERAEVEWFLSIDKNTLPPNTDGVLRKITVNKENINFTKGFTDLHTKSYEEILAGRGFTIGDTKEAIDLIFTINQKGGK